MPFFSCLSALAGTSSTMLDRNGESGRSSLVLDLRGESTQSFTIKCNTHCSKAHFRIFWKVSCYSLTTSVYEWDPSPLAKTIAPSLEVRTPRPGKGSVACLMTRLLSHLPSSCPQSLGSQPPGHSTFPPLVGMP